MAVSNEIRNLKASAWSITINNPTDEDKEAWKGIKTLHWVKDASGQLEQGENGTIHIQGLLKTDYVRFAQVKKALPRAHIEKARNTLALTNYVQKEETRLATIENSKVATPRLVQERLTSAVKENIYMNGTPAVWRYNYTKDCKRKIWTKEICGEVKEFKELVHKNKVWIQDHADELIDNVVEQLIEEGNYGLEFVIANNQVRNGYKKFLSAIVIRHANSEESSSEEIEEISET